MHISKISSTNSFLYKWTLSDSNTEPSGYEPDALTNCAKSPYNMADDITQSAIYLFIVYFRKTSRQFNATCDASWIGNCVHHTLEEIRTLTESTLNRLPLPVGLREHNSMFLNITFFSTQRLNTVSWFALPTPLPSPQSKSNARNTVLHLPACQFAVHNELANLPINH